MLGLMGKDKSKPGGAAMAHVIRTLLGDEMIEGGSKTSDNQLVDYANDMMVALRSERPEAFARALEGFIRVVQDDAVEIELELGGE
jgi:hypothetical protein